MSKQVGEQEGRQRRFRRSVKELQRIVMVREKAAVSGGQEKKAIRIWEQGKI